MKGSRVQVSDSALENPGRKPVGVNKWGGDRQKAVKGPREENGCGLKNPQPFFVFIPSRHSARRQIFGFNQVKRLKLGFIISKMYIYRLITRLINKSLKITEYLYITSLFIQCSLELCINGVRIELYIFNQIIRQYAVVF